MVDRQARTRVRAWIVAGCSNLSMAKVRVYTSRVSTDNWMDTDAETEEDSDV